jgi:hypothetical protein
VRVAAVLLLVCALVALACAPRPITGSQLTTASVVTLLKPAILADEDGAPTPPRWVPACNAFPVVLADGSVVLATAEHCAAVYPPGSNIHYLAVDGWGHGHASLLSRGDGVAFLAVADPLLEPLAIGPVPEPGWPASVVSSLAEESASGHVLAILGPRYVATDLRVERGWSGSPMLNAAGKVWGVASLCEAVPVSTRENDYRCVGGTIAAVLP